MKENEKKYFNNKPVGDENIQTKEILYECDGKKCESGCSIECNYTSDIKHAKNFRRILGEYEYYKETERKPEVEVILAVISMIIAVISVVVNLMILRIE